MSEIIRVKNLSKLYGSNYISATEMLKTGSSKKEVLDQTGTTAALFDVSFDINEGEIFVIIGLSGSGKSTLIRCLNGLNKPTDGEVLVGGMSVISLQKKALNEFRRSEVAMVFQHFGLMDHRSVLSNIAYGLEVKGVSKKERELKAKEMTAMVGLDGLEHSSIRSLSGGMKQRVGIARALANDPKVLLMDEPFSALDPLVRNDMQMELISIQRKLKKTVVFITHDINEAFKLGDRVAIMLDGRLVQLDTPENMIANPINDYVREFIKDADHSRVLTAKNIMLSSDMHVKIGEKLSVAASKIQEFSLLGISVVDDNGKYLGALPRDIGNTEKFSEESIITKEMLIASHHTLHTTLIRELIPLVVSSPLPLAVLDEQDNFIGSLTKACVLSSFI